MLNMAKNTMGTKLPRKLEQKMQIVGEQIKLARLRRNLREWEAQDNREHPADGAGRHRIRKSSRESRCQKPWKRQQKIR